MMKWNSGPEYLEKKNKARVQVYALKRNML